MEHSKSNGDIAATTTGVSHVRRHMLRRRLFDLIIIIIERRALGGGGGGGTGMPEDGDEEGEEGGVDDGDGVGPEAEELLKPEAHNAQDEEGDGVGKHDGVGPDGEKGCLFIFGVVIVVVVVLGKRRMEGALVEEGVEEAVLEVRWCVVEEVRKGLRDGGVVEVAQEEGGGFPEETVRFHGGRDAERIDTRRLVVGIKKDTAAGRCREGGFAGEAHGGEAVAVGTEEVVEEARSGGIGEDAGVEVGKETTRTVEVVWNVNLNFRGFLHATLEHGSEVRRLLQNDAVGRDGSTIGHDSCIRKRAVADQ